ncbi:MAG: bifunctional pyr operon transcriptional regulator/uracil phosphoribosyltransferase PyrR [Phycisphaerae bacterium]|nr:bifunctional pyr operon transcriptional regulator/uracil phosphoribosyltransferase PyrR [Phycisphaerae bacterium]
MREHYDSAAVAGMIEGLAAQIAERFRPDHPFVVIGIRTRGETLAERLCQRLTHHSFTAIERGVLDITLYRDDLSEIGPRPMVRPTRIDTDIAGKPLLLVDDVLFTGRTVRAALDALADFGRPAAIRLAVLVDRGGRELPIQPDYVALRLGELPLDRVVKVRLTERDGRDAIDVEKR